jgi:hypothetical protein
MAKHNLVSSLVYYSTRSYRGPVMGRPKGSSTKAAAKPAEPVAPEPAISKAAAVRAALADGLDGLDDIAAYVKTKHGHDIPKPQISAYKTQEKAKVRKSQEPVPKSAKPKSAALPTAKHGGGAETDLITAMEAIKPYVKEHGAERLKRIIDLLD